MSRSILKPVLDKTPLVVRVDKGGCQEITPLDEAKKIGLITTNDINVSNGIGVLDSNSKLPSNIIPSSLTSNYEPYLTLPEYVISETTTPIVINNFDRNIDYTISVSQGDYNLIDNVLYYKAPLVNTDTLVLININGREVNLLVKENFIVKPSITAPVNLSTDIPEYLTVAGSPFSLENTSPVSILSDPLVNINNVISNDNSILVYRDPNFNSTRGRVVTFVNNNGLWKETDTLAPGVATDTYFGSGVGLNADGTRMIVGAMHYGSTNYGRVYIYSRNASNDGWDLETSFSGPSPQNYDKFGWDVDMTPDGNTVTIGIALKDAGALDAGAVRIYNYSNGSWNSAYYITSPDPANPDTFGSHVFLNADKDKLIVNAYRDDNANGSNLGSCYYFTLVNGSWVYKQKIIAPISNSVGSFGIYSRMSTDGNVFTIYHDGNCIRYLRNPSTDLWEIDAIINTPLLEYYNKDIDDLIVIESNTAKFYKNSHLISTDWELATDPNFNTIVQSSLNDTANLTTWNLNSLSPNTTYYVRVKYNGSQFGSSEWSEPVAFTTEEQFIADTEVGILRASDGAYNDQYSVGIALNSNGTILAVGASKEDTLTTDAGKVYIYDLDVATNTYIERGTIIPSDGASQDEFGFSVSLNGTGDVLAVGSVYRNDAGTDAGKVYIYDWNASTNTWVERGTLIASDAAASNFYGVSVDLNFDGNILVVGASGKNLNTGQVYVYDWDTNTSTWIERNKLNASDAGTESHYGYSVSISGDGNIIGVGASRKTTSAGSGAGQVYIYDWNASTNTWDERTILTASDAASGDYFGVSSSLNNDGSVLVIGSELKDTSAGTDSGQVYVFKWNASTNTWDEQYTLLGSDIVGGDRFGRSVSISKTNGTIVVGSHFKAGSGGSYQGAVYIFK